MSDDRLTLRYGLASYYSLAQGRRLTGQTSAPLADLTARQIEKLMKSGWEIDKNGITIRRPIAPGIFDREETDGMATD